MRILLITLTLIVLSSCKPETPSISFVALGDAPYHTEGYPSLESLIKKVNTTKPSLIIHTGDTHGHYTCDNTTIDNLRRYMNDFVAPVLYTPGDNEWTDCGSTKVGTFDPLERLNYLRQTHFKDGKTLGTYPETVINQKKDGYPENARLIKNNIGFITLHVVGSNNNFIQSDMKAMKEFFARNKANLAWLKESFVALKEADSIVVALHADMFERIDTSFLLIKSTTFKFLGNPLSPFGRTNRSPFRDIGMALGKYSSEFKKPVLLLHGDSHIHEIYQPFKKNHPYLHAIEVYGHPHLAAIEIAVRPGSKQPFQVNRVFSPY